MSFLDRFRRKKEDEAARFARLSRTGRITEGSVLDIKSDDQDRITHVFYPTARRRESSRRALTTSKRPGHRLHGSTLLSAPTHASRESL